MSYQISSPSQQQPDYNRHQSLRIQQPTAELISNLISNGQPPLRLVDSDSDSDRVESYTPKIQTHLHHPKTAMMKPNKNYTPLSPISPLHLAAIQPQPRLTQYPSVQHPPEALNFSNTTENLRSAVEFFKDDFTLLSLMKIFLPKNGEVVGELFIN